MGLEGLGKDLTLAIVEGKAEKRVLFTNYTQLSLAFCPLRFAISEESASCPPSASPPWPCVGRSPGAGAAGWPPRPLQHACARPDPAGCRPGSRGSPLQQELLLQLEPASWELGSQRQAVHPQRSTLRQAGMLFCLFLSETNVLFKRQCVCAHTPKSA